MQNQNRRLLTAEAHDLLVRNGVIVNSGHSGKAGYVTVSNFGWNQNIQEFRWEDVRVTEEPETMMRHAYRDTAELAKVDGIGPLAVAFVPAVKCIAGKATSGRAIGHYLPPALLAKRLAVALVKAKKGA